MQGYYASELRQLSVAYGSRLYHLGATLNNEGDVYELTTQLAPVLFQWCVFVVLDGELRVISANRGFSEFFEVESAGIVGPSLWDLNNGYWDAPDIRQLLGKDLGVLPASSRSFRGPNSKIGLPSAHESWKSRDAPRWNWPRRPRQQR